MNENDELELLLRKVHAGDRTARDTLLSLLRTRARRYAEFLIGGRFGARADASDLAQEAFLKILGDGFDPAAFPSAPHLLAWLNVIVRSAVTDLRRHHGAQLRDARRDVAGGELFGGLASDTTGPEQRAERAEEAELLPERLARVEAALQLLPENQRAVFLLRMRESLSFEKIAERIGVTEGNARVLMVRATERLRELVGELT